MDGARPGRREARSGHQRDSEEIQRTGRVVRPFVTPADGAEHLVAGIVTFPPVGDSDPHAHAVEEEVLYVVSGCGALVCDGEAHQLEPGSFVFVPPGVEHFVRNDGDQPLTLFYAFSPTVVIGTW
jgi:quercetin dioxygenase-like cupin family protein